MIMSKIVKLSDVVDKVSTNIDRFNTDIKYYIGKGHGECGELAITEHGDLKRDVNTLGFKFHFAFKPGDTLFMSRSFELRKAGMATFEGLCSDSTYILRTKNENVLLHDYLPILIQQNAFWDFCNSNFTGGVNHLINWSTLAAYEFELPSIEIQKEVAQRTWAAYRLKEAYRHLITASDEMVKSQFLEWFGNPMLAPKGEQASISDVADIILGSTPSSKNPDYWDGNLKWITPAEMTDESFTIYDTERHITESGRASANLTNLPKGTVLFSTRAPIGKVAIAGTDMYCNQGFKNFVCSDSLNNVFLFYTLRFNREYLISLGTGTTFKELSKKSVETLKIAVPPMELQKQFEQLYRQADKSKYYELN